VRAGPSRCSIRRSDSAVFQELVSERNEIIEDDGGRLAVYLFTDLLGILFRFPHDSASGIGRDALIMEGHRYRKRQSEVSCDSSGIFGHRTFRTVGFKWQTDDQSDGIELGNKGFDVLEHRFPGISRKGLQPTCHGLGFIGNGNACLLGSEVQCDQSSGKREPGFHIGRVQRFFFFVLRHRGQLADNCQP
jgi:hypothetical protein